MASELITTLTVTSAEFENPINLQILTVPIPSPIGFESKTVITSPAGTEAETITETVTIAGLPIVNGKVLATYDFAKLGGVWQIIGDLVRSVDAVITVDVREA